MRDKLLRRKREKSVKIAIIMLGGRVMLLVKVFKGRRKIVLYGGLKALFMDARTSKVHSKIHRAIQLSRLLTDCYIEGQKGRKTFEYGSPRKHSLLLPL